MKNINLLFLLFLSSLIYSQQTIRGKITDSETGMPLPYSTVILLKDSSFVSGATSDSVGNFRLVADPGRYTIRFSTIGYESGQIKDLTVTAGKESILNLEMSEESEKMDEVVIVADQKALSTNEMALTGSRVFSVEETDRYAGSRGDPARMASNFAGVQGADDSRNDIVIRGNSPLGVNWRFENIDIPNPNHFAIAGSTGGPVGIINNKYLRNSGFFTSAFPAEYGNAIAGVFDLKMRNGNNEKHEFTGQLGFLGTELSAEGPLSKKNGSSYLLNFRYSTLKLFEALKMPIGTDAVPEYFDGALRLNFPLKKGGGISLWGIGGKSNIEILVSKDTEPSEELYGDRDRDQYFGSHMIIAGSTLTKPYKNGFLNVSLASSVSESHSRHELVYRATDFSIDSMVLKMGYRFLEQRNSAHIFFNAKLNPKHTVKPGVIADVFLFNLADSNYNHHEYFFDKRYDYQGSTLLLRPYISHKWKATSKVTVSTGLHAQYLTMSSSFALEPRISAAYELTPKHRLSAGYGLHSQMIPTYIYFKRKILGDGSVVLPNKNVDFIRSNHYVITYDFTPKNTFRIKTEIYYQSLFDVPVEKKSSSFSVINQGTGFARFFPDSLINEGTGTNKGVELTIEKFFNKSFFFLITASLFDSKYTGSDGVERDTDFNGRYAANFLAGKEFKAGKSSVISLGIKVTTAGGRRYTPIDTSASAYELDDVVIDSLRNSLQFKDYFRTDLKVTWRIDKKKVTHELGLDLVNIFNTKNILSLTYAPDPRNPNLNPIKEEYQLGFLPLFYYRIDF